MSIASMMKAVNFIAFWNVKVAKNANSICSFLYDFVSKKLQEKPDTKKK